MAQLKSFLLFILFLIILSQSSCVNESALRKEVTPPSNETIVFVGTYTEKEPHVHGKAEGIYVCKLNEKTGELKKIVTTPMVINPSYLAIHPNRQYVYAVNEIGNPEGTVSAFEINPDSYELTFINKASAKGKAPCYISVEHSGQYALVANYVTGNVVMLPILSDGKLGEAVASIFHEGQGEHPRQDAAHAHFIAENPTNQGYAYAVDLGIDKIIRYQIDTLNGGLLRDGEIVTTNKGAGARHLAWHPTKQWMYVINELDGTVEVFKKNTGEDPLWQSVQIIPTLAEPSKDVGSADIHLTPDGKFLYATNRGKYNNIAMYQVNERTGLLTFLGNQPTKGKTPRNFTITKNGQFLLVANQDSDNIVTFKINQQTGLLEDIGQELKIKTPVCLQIL